jgi:hypothetical protein
LIIKHAAAAQVELVYCVYVRVPTCVRRYVMSSGQRDDDDSDDSDGFLSRKVSRQAQMTFGPLCKNARHFSVAELLSDAAGERGSSLAVGVWAAGDFAAPASTQSFALLRLGRFGHAGWHKAATSKSETVAILGVVVASGGGGHVWIVVAPSQRTIPPPHARRRPAGAQTGRSAVTLQQGRNKFLDVVIIVLWLVVI